MYCLVEKVVVNCSTADNAMNACLRLLLPLELSMEHIGVTRCQQLSPPHFQEIPLLFS